MITLILKLKNQIILVVILKNFLRMRELDASRVKANKLPELRSYRVTKLERSYS